MTIVELWLSELMGSFLLSSGELGLKENGTDRKKNESVFVLKTDNRKSRKVDILFQSFGKTFGGRQVRREIALFEARILKPRQETIWV